MFQTHKFLILPGINQNFNLFPQRWVFRQVFTPIWGTIGEIPPISTKFTYFCNRSEGVCNIHGSKYTLLS